MASTLLISALDIPFNALWISPAAACDQDLNEANEISRNRYSLTQYNAATSPNSTRYDLGTSVTKAVDHLIVARADIAKTAGLTTLNLAGGSDGTTFGTTALNNTTFSSQALLGPRSNDYVVEIATTTALRWWRLTWTGSSSKFCHSTVSFGQWFDMGVEVSKYTIDRIPAKEAKFYSDSGAEYQCRVSEEIYQFTMTWKHVTVAKLTSFLSSIARFQHRIPLFLYTTTAGGRHELLDSQRVVQVHIVPASIKWSVEYGGYQDLTVQFEEILG